MRSSGLVYAVLVATLVALASTTPLKFEDILPVERSQQIYRLPTAVRPTHYVIYLAPNYETRTSGFTGNVTINVDVVERTNAIIVHNDALNIDTAATRVYSGTNETPLEIATQTYDPIRHFQIITFRSNLPLGNYTVSLSFSGNFATDMSGMYLSSYQAGSETRWLVATQFQATYARRAFPCFDEPGLKATFDVSLAHFANQTALSNMPNISTSVPDNTIGNRVWTRFATTPVMSTYILAFIVSDFESRVSSDQFFGVWSRPEAIDTTSWALEATPNLYQIFLNLVRTEDPWPKIDQIALPDFSAGAMENWGLITYREQLLLWKEGESSLITREQIASIISHELAHIWFGNLVSPVWWDHLWFSEGFASFYQYLTPSLTYPLWRYAERIVTDQQLPAMVADSLETTRPMTNVVGSPGSILASFDNVAYAKSAAVFRMLNRIMREDLFTIAIANFLSESAHGVFEPSTLWRHMQVVADANSAVQNHIPLASVMESWTNQPGYPLVTVVRNYSTTVVAFRQERFFMDPNSPTADPDSQRWWIPITYTFGTAPAGCNSAWLQPDWLRAQDNAIMSSGVANTTWILANCQAIGFYRTNYDAQNWELLTEYLKNSNFQQINAINRAVLIDDALNLARAGYIEYPIALNLIAYLVQETDFVVWRAAITPLTWLNRVLTTNEYFTYWQASLRVLISNVYSSLGWTAAADDAHVTRIHRGQILQLACQLDHADARSAAEGLFNLWIANPQQNPVDPDLKSAVYCWGIRNATEATWDVVWGRFLATDLATEENVLLTALGCSQNPTILEKYLQLSITPNSGIRSQDTYSVFSSVLISHQDNVDFLLNFIDNFSAAIAEFYGGMNAVTSMLTSISNRITTQAQLEKFRAIVSSAQLGASTVLIETVLRNAERNLIWISNNVPVIVSWLEEQAFIPATEAPVPTTVPPTTTPVVTTPAVTTPAVTTPAATTPVVTTEGTPTESGSGATVSTSSLYFLFSSLALVMSNHLVA